MSRTHFVPFRLTALVAGCGAALVLLTVSAQRGAAEKAPAEEDCLNRRDSVCRMVETCTPKGFEANGTCQWNYTVSRSYWKN